ncbi:MAG: hypothetical protein IJ903_08445 [Ruminococcus sp.]|nr:hypothetical protein [Ruminococcus sp.]
MNNSDMVKLEEKEIIDISKRYRNLFAQYTKTYKNTFESEFDKAMNTVVREELSAGSDMTLGYYCPSPVEDLIIGNVHRGKILKRVTKRSKPDTKYGFTKDGEMAVFVDLPPEGYTDYDVRGFVLYDESTVTYICFRKSEEGTEPEWIAQEEHDSQGRIVRYTFGLFNDFRCNEIEQEIYSYDDQGMEKVIMWDYLSANCITQQIYRLHHDNDGLLIGFESLDSDFWKGHIFEIAPSKRRKI